jgi:hypothetical protein
MQSFSKAILKNGNFLQLTDSPAREISFISIAYRPHIFEAFWLEG